jgi:hypothetical protein
LSREGSARSFPTLQLTDVEWPCSCPPVSDCSPGRPRSRNELIYGVLVRRAAERDGDWLLTRELGRGEPRQVMPLSATALAGTIESVKCKRGLIRMRESQIRALRGVVTICDSTIGHFSAQTMSAAAARVVAKIAIARRSQKFVFAD